MPPTGLFQHIASNRRKSIGLVFLAIALLGAMGAGFGYWQTGSPWIGLTVTMPAWPSYSTQRLIPG